MDSIFNLIKSKDFKKIKEIITNNNKLDLNIADQQNNYLIHYILFSF